MCLYNLTYIHCKNISVLNKLDISWFTFALKDTVARYLGIKQSVVPILYNIWQKKHGCINQTFS